MEIITRSQALKAGAITYFTGQPCKNGHVNYRYVKNGACSDCVKANNAQPVDPNAAARREYCAELVQIKLRIFQADEGVLKDAALAFGMMRFPEIQLGDVYPRLLPTDVTSGTAVYRVNCHVDDVAPIRELAAGLLSARSLNGNVARRAVFGDAIASVPIPPVPDSARISRPGDFDWKDE